MPSNEGGGGNLPQKEEIEKASYTIVTQIRITVGDAHGKCVRAFLTYMCACMRTLIRVTFIIIKVPLYIPPIAFKLHPPPQLRKQKVNFPAAKNF